MGYFDQTAGLDSKHQAAIKINPGGSGRCSSVDRGCLLAVCSPEIRAGKLKRGKDCKLLHAFTAARLLSSLECSDL